MSKGPKFTQHFVPLLEVLREKGGSAPAAEATDAVIEKERIPEKELEKTNKNGGSNVRNAIAWARQYLVYSGHLDSSTRGIWALTAKGLGEDLSKLDPVDLFRRIQLARKGDGIVPEALMAESPPVPEGVEPPPQSASPQLLPLLQSLSPAGFERLCQRLLLEHGFQRVKVTGRSGDGGIDGEGILEINALLSFKVMFQCKRYQGSVGSKEIRDFRGAMVGRADKGIFLTTGHFTMEAKKEAVRDGTDPIELVDGERLVKMFEQRELGLQRQVVYRIDAEFFREYQ